ncbi:MAG: hypothetical protein A07HN63_01759 [uncultured archaeon A07HN63]|nr:MAG: hypothetical protein A07HN63_01759 [uncultured archaeon A07HN63]
MKRRTALMALGALATGSGAVATSASISGTADSSSDITVVVEEELEVKAGKAFNDDGSVKSSYQNQYVPFPSNNEFFGNQSSPSTDPLKDISRSDAPVATVSPRNTTVNDSLKLKVALSIENTTDTFTFEDILTIENNGGDAKDVGIMYDRDYGQYGDDVIVPGDFETELSQHDVQHIYQFRTDDPGNAGQMRISPDPSRGSDDPTESRSVDGGSSIQVDLEIDLTTLTLNTVLGTATLDPKDISGTA